ncbi:hypothetical protein KQX54_021734 [Cotesia glomerata]|uniref:Uncharacterized protein n=1 Tax=Cotesia glomerata TaxID=32391 RepID=A0AAV7IWT4_COTGL|nr:hypothetical protein KQX54_021734 [Cotesia glomerata]
MERESPTERDSSQRCPYQVAAKGQVKSEGVQNGMEVKGLSALYYPLHSTRWFSRSCARKVPQGSKATTELAEFEGDENTTRGMSVVMWSLYRSQETWDLLSNSGFACIMYVWMDIIVSRSYASSRTSDSFTGTIAKGFSVLVSQRKGSRTFLGGIGEKVIQWVLGLMVNYVN